eukprot:CCRYP_011232-RC/>CCRYP_011232-RC protein AED:0.07 eAED:0.07 QI:178/0.84/0.78/1/0.69/0.5/14/828/1553
MSSYPPRRSIFPHRGTDSMGDKSVDGSVQQSVSSVGTDRASNHGNGNMSRVPLDALNSPPLFTSPPTSVPLPPVPTTVLAISGEIGGDNNADAVTNGSSRDGDVEGTPKTVKLTAEALAIANKHEAEKAGRNIFGIVEVSSNLSRSSSESGLKVPLHRNGGIPTQVKVVPTEEHGDGSSGPATPAHFQPWEASSVASSLGDPLQIPVAIVESIHEMEEKHNSPINNSKGMGERELSELALAVHLASETPPKANLSSSKDSSSHSDPTTLPPISHNDISCTPSSSPSKIVHNSSVLVDATIASTLPPTAPTLRSIPNSPMPASAMKTPSANSSSSPSVTRNNSRKATFQEPSMLTRTSSNASSSTTATNTSATKRIRIGVCAMDKKARSKPMAEILSRLDPQTFEPVFFGDSVILKEPVENWPVCDVLIAFYSNGYPLDKAEKYVNLRRPYLLNDLKMQRVLMDRRRVYDLLEEAGIDVPRHVFVSRDGYVSTGSGDGPRVTDGNGSGCPEDPEFEEHDDHIEVNGVIIHKPFVEKPVDADDHNIAIYYPSSAGGGCKKLFRKVGDRSSEFYPEINEVRRDGSYIYEEFIETQGTDVKMYTVGPDYGHAEARKSPAVDGVVERNPDGKEVRFPVILTLREKEIARRIVLVFKQQVCGFDILRIQEGDSLVSYVCDVNGWSFVKIQYYDDCAQILTEHMLAVMKPKSKISFSALAPLLATMEDSVDDTASRKSKTSKKRHHRERSIVDRVKEMLLGDNISSNIPEGNANSKGDDKLLDLQSLEGDNNSIIEEPVDFSGQPVRELPNQLVTEAASIIASGASSLADLDDETLSRASGKNKPPSTHQEELRCVITIIRHGDRTPKQKLKGDINDKHFLKYFEDHAKDVRKDLKVKAKKPMSEFLETVKAVIKDKESEGSKKNRDDLYKARHIRDILQRWKFSGLNRKLQMKPKKWDEEEGPDGPVTKCTELQLIVKWGGDLTKLGEKQAINLGNRLRNELYPMSGGGGILRLHSTFRHDLKIKTSDEGRVMKTAASFAKGMLELEGDIPPILVSLVHKEKTSGHMLDPSGNKEVKKDLEICKKKINANMQKDIDYGAMTKEERESLVGPERLTSLHRALKEVGNPRKTLIAIHATIGKLVEQLDDMLGELASGDEEVIEGGAGLKGKEEIDEALKLTERWKLLQNKLYDEEKDIFDLSRVPDVHDNVRFDMLHNPHLGLTETLSKLYDLAKSMADCVVPQEYGITVEEKRDIGCKMCETLLEKINFDLAIARTDNQVDMRYLINMDYSADLPINSMGRRVRSRLYFTSESHLHSLLNVLRFPSSKENCVQCPLSYRGQQILADASELCYLTQVVIRLFEDTQKPSDDPKRFRVEIWFSPGATATPLHMAEMYRENDASRFDTEKLQKISIDGLSCTQVEAYFAEAMKDGKPKRNDTVEEPLKAPEDGQVKQDKEIDGKENGREKEPRLDASEIQSEDTKDECMANTSLPPSDKPTEEKQPETSTDFSTPPVQFEPDTRDPFSQDRSWRTLRIVSFALGATALTYLLSKGARALHKRY